MLGLIPVLDSKAIPVQTWTGPEGSRKLRFPDFKTSAHEGGKVVSPARRPPLPPGNTPSAHFCQKLSRRQGHSVAGRLGVPLVVLHRPLTVAKLLSALLASLCVSESSQ